MGGRAMVRAAAVFLGALLLIGSFLAGRLSLSASGGVSEGRVLLAVFGVLLAGAGAAGKRLPALWKGFGRLLFCGCLALLLWFSVTGFLGALARGRPALLPPGTVPGAAGPLAYRPHVLWTLPGSVPGRPGTRPVWLYGGTLDDAGPLLQGLGIEPGEGVSDRRQPGYNSTQSLILLMLDLRGNSVPAEVILTAGEADVRAALSTGDPVWPLGSNAFLEATGPSCDLSGNLEGSELAMALAEAQLVNRAVLMALAAEYGFRASFVWLPGDGAFPEQALVDSLMASLM